MLTFTRCVCALKIDFNLDRFYFVEIVDEPKHTLAHLHRLASFADLDPSNVTSAISSILPLEPEASNGSGGSGFSISQFSLISIFIGLVIEVSFTGILAITLRVLRKESKNFWKIAWLMVFFNVWCIEFMVFFTLSFFAVEENCVLINSSSNVSAHLFCISYDAFMFFKTYVICKRKQTVLACIVLMISHRAVWTVWDIAKSTVFTTRSPTFARTINTLEVGSDTTLQVLSLMRFARSCRLWPTGHICLLRLDKWPRLLQRRIFCGQS
ncbi:hypothetical protein BJ741DRAFT_109834 [Chytriomyces cf. hyalinus JEL632]|nr:hypothetical protein BJ741DRAFT_109834 [Chytriomyces cf. hyalinus JEL632]